MPRVKGGFKSRRKHNKLLKLAKGFRGTRSKLVKRAHEAVVRAGEHAFAGRRIRKRDMRSLWITRISAALSKSDIKYSRFIRALNTSGLDINRKQLSELISKDISAFQEIVKKVGL